jgi:hypothetical protein
MGVEVVGDRVVWQGNHARFEVWPRLFQAGAPASRYCGSGKLTGLLLPARSTARTPNCRLSLDMRLAV